LLLGVDPELFGEAAPVAGAHAALEAFIPYIEAHLAGGVRLSTITRHLLGLFAGRPGARAYRRRLATDAVKPGAGLEVLRAAIAEVDRATARVAA
jgi:tRNA-dihydrouridine synthase A